MTTVETSDGLTLESAWSPASPAPVGAVVLCHPDPRQGGTMNAPLIKAVAGVMSAAGLAVLRFNFRGVGKSEGAIGDGKDEVRDVAAAVAAARAHPGLPVGVAGWSFGAVVALRWQAETGSSLRYAGIAPPVRLAEQEGSILPDPASLAPAERLFVLGDRDQFTIVVDLARYAEAIGGRLEVLAGSDHFFYFREQKVGGLLVEHFGGG